MKEKIKKLFKGQNTFFEAKVVSRNVITDFIQGVRNFLGLELKAYTNTINEVANELINKAKEKNIDWFRVDIEEVGRGGFMISVYGVYKDE